MNTTPLSQISAILFAAETPLSFEQLQQATDLETDKLRAALTQLDQQLAPLGLMLVQVAEKWRIQVRADHAQWVQRALAPKAPKLSRAQLETLAIIAHKQPVTRAEIEQIRGVSVASGVLQALQQHGWIRTHGHKAVPGRPALWVTTPTLLEDLGLQSKAQLQQQLDKIIHQAQQAFHEQQTQQ
ncbi:MAG TPA: SMC-Scp complex subunit ScpB [Piscirickettsiaceae bacterium]|nr:SMC-Scp complex subunit ScpB [Piscirickettsiaceae bacterium]HIQ39884.1 SMC-Scp complex subunit ScpB [Sulfurivirga caldicuralii]